MAEARDRARRAFDAVRVGDLAAQHLKPAAQAQHTPAPADMRGKIDVPAFGAERFQVGDGGLRAGQQDNMRGSR